ncbi:MAG: hypothetical protein HY319_08115 [Armatimonadetes bacterium]|nr:hypothetical protein [Armatimonadota bacterium]
MNITTSVGNKKPDSPKSDSKNTEKKNTENKNTENKNAENKKAEDPPRDGKSEERGPTRRGEHDPKAGRSSESGSSQNARTNDREQGTSAWSDEVSLSDEAHEKEPPGSTHLNLNALTGALNGTRAGETEGETEADPLRDQLDTYLEDHSFYWLDGNRRGDVLEKKPLEPEVRDRIAETLMKYPPHVVEDILDSGMDFRFVDPDNPPTDLDPFSKKKWPGEMYTGAYGAQQDGKPGNMVLNQKLLDPKFADKYGTLEDTVRHETAHYWDDMRLDTTDRLLKNGESGNASTHDRKLNDMFDSYKEDFKKLRDDLGIDPKDFIRKTERDALKGKNRELKDVLFDGGYSLHSVEEYLSMGVEYYLGSDKDRRALKNVAPDLYDYIQNDFLAPPEPQKELLY